MNTPTEVEKKEAHGSSYRDSGQTISVIISDANAMSCELLASALGRMRRLKVVKCVTTSQELVRAVAESAPDVVVVSSHLADGPFSGFKTLRQLQAAPTQSKFVVLLDDPDPELVIDAFRVGSHGVFKRSAPVTLLAKCIVSIHEGQVWASSEDLQHLLHAVQKTMPLRCLDSRGRPLLSKRETQIMSCVAEGLTNREISIRLGLSEHTVKNHLFHTYEKLGISSKVELILYALTERS